MGIFIFTIMGILTAAGLSAVVDKPKIKIDISNL